MRHDMMQDPWLDRLSEYLDGEMPPTERHELDAHLIGCAACRTVLDELRAVVSIAASAPDLEPARDLWPGIAAGIGAQGTPVARLEERRLARGRISFTLTQLAAAAAVLLMLGGGAVWLAFQTGRGSVAPVAQQAPASDAVQLVSTEYREHEEAIGELEGVLDGSRAQLDTATVRVLEESLATIDRAIADARAALEQDPANPFLHRHLDGAMKKKIDILRRAVSVRRAQS